VPVVRSVARPRADTSGTLMTREELVRWGEALGARLAPGTLVTLQGDLGAGKTTLVQAICRGYGVVGEVTSPTFALVHRYEAPRSPVHHVDLYRLATPGELDSLGFDELLAEPALTCLEWPERASGRLPAARIDIRLGYDPGDPSRRRLVVA